MTNTCNRIGCFIPFLSILLRSWPPKVREQPSDYDDMPHGGAWNTDGRLWFRNHNREVETHSETNKLCTQMHFLYIWEQAVVGITKDIGVWAIKLTLCADAKVRAHPGSRRDLPRCAQHPFRS